MISTIRLSLVAGILSLLQVSVCNAGVTVLEIKKITTGGGYSRPQWSPDGKKIYAQAADAGVVVMNADGTNIVKLSDSDGYDRKFAVSPDGTKILYEFNETKGQDSNLWIMNSDGTGKKKIAEDAGDPSWSADGTKFVFRKVGVWIGSFDGTGIKKLADGGGEPKFLNNNAIVYHVIENDKPGLQLINTNGQEIKFYPVGWVSNIITADTKIYFVANKLSYLDLNDEGKKVDLINAENVSSGLISPEHVSISPDRKFLVYDYRLEETDSAATLGSELYVLNLIDLTKKRITATDNIHEAFPSWSPDGGRILFMDYSGLDIYVATITIN